MGKLGGREMTAASDLDLILIYDYAAEAQQSDGAKPLAPSHYYTRLTQRLINAISAPTAQGTLYEVDMRLRPSGQKGPVATRLSSFVGYQTDEAWTWEHMALTRARVIAGSQPLGGAVEAAIREILTRPRDRHKTAGEVREMRERIAAEKGTADIWNLKQVRGGLVDLEFIAQYLQLIAAPSQPEVLDQNTLAALDRLALAGVIGRGGGRQADCRGAPHPCPDADYPAEPGPPVRPRSGAPGTEGPARPGGGRRHVRGRGNGPEGGARGRFGCF